MAFSTVYLIYEIPPNFCSFSLRGKFAASYQIIIMIFLEMNTSTHFVTTTKGPVYQVPSEENKLATGILFLVVSPKWSLKLYSVTHHPMSQKKKHWRFKREQLNIPIVIENRDKHGNVKMATISFLNINQKWLGKHFMLLLDGEESYDVYNFTIKLFTGTVSFQI